MVRLNTLDARAPTLSPSAVRVAGVQLMEADGTAAGVYTKDVYIPAYAAILDITIYQEALWTAGTSALLDVGLYTVATPPVAIDADAFFSALDLKATDLLADQSVSFAFAGGDNGLALATATHVLSRLETTPRWLRFAVTTVGTVGTAGKTFAFVEYAVPELDPATFVAT